ncbi:hypothetical protein C8J57DRAFT_1512254 [Mycena rebaudengoi]|nr:hypothetical protein C8J57DRAFT_1512254 [Mycena rebaudengoi]
MLKIQLLHAHEQEDKRGEMRAITAELETPREERSSSPSSPFSSFAQSTSSSHTLASTTDSTTRYTAERAPDMRARCESVRRDRKSVADGRGHEQPIEYASHHSTIVHPLPSPTYPHSQIRHPHINKLTAMHLYADAQTRGVNHRWQDISGIDHASYHQHPPSPHAQPRGVNVETRGAQRWAHDERKYQHVLSPASSSIPLPSPTYPHSQIRHPHTNKLPARHLYTDAQDMGVNVETRGAVHDERKHQHVLFIPPPRINLRFVTPVRGSSPPYMPARSPGGRGRAVPGRQRGDVAALEHEQPDESNIDHASDHQHYPSPPQHQPRIRHDHTEKRKLPVMQVYVDAQAGGAYAGRRGQEVGHEQTDKSGKHGNGVVPFTVAERAHARQTATARTPYVAVGGAVDIGRLEGRAARVQRRSSRRSGGAGSPQTQGVLAVGGTRLAEVTWALVVTEVQCTERTVPVEASRKAVHDGDDK